jgi:hypothetical protein
LGDGTPATFHEQRSLAERLYEAQGIDTKNLGHKSQIRQLDITMTDTMIAVKGG